MLIGVAITILFIAAGGAFWKREYSLGMLLLAVGAVLAFAFFRKWKVDLVIIGLIWIMVNAGTIALVRPTIPGILVTAGSGVGIVLLARWKAGRHRPPQN
jgi:hypothetical protein